MNPRTTAILFAVALALGSFVYFYEIRGEEGRRQGEALAKRLFPGVEADAIQWIELRTSDGQDARIERREGGGSSWELVKPLVFPVDNFSVDSVASTLAEVESEAAYEEPGEASVYGLDGEVPELRFGTAEAEHGLRTGDATPMGSATYVRVAGSEPVYTVSTARVSALRKSLDDLRDKRILGFDTDAVERFTARWPGGRVVLARQSGEDAEDPPRAEWRLLAPVEGEADAEAVADLLSELSFLRAVSFADDPPPDSETGLDSPAFVIELELGAGEPAAGDPEAGGAAAAPADAPEARRLELAVGAAESDGHRYVRAGRPTLFRIRAERLDDFPREVIDYRFRDVASFPLLEAGRLELVFQSESEEGGVSEAVTVTATRSEGEWSSEPEAMDPAKIARLVSELSRLRASDILAEAVGPDESAALGLDPSQVTLRVRRVGGEGAEGEGEDGEGEPLAELRIGEVRGSEGIVAQSDAGGTVYELDYALAEHLPVSLEAFRNRFLFVEGEGVEGEGVAGEAGADDGAEVLGELEIPLGDLPQP